MQLTSRNLGGGGGRSSGAENEHVEASPTLQENLFITTHPLRLVHCNS